MMCRIFGNLNVCWIYVTNWSTHLTQETGFFGGSTTVMKYSRKNPVSGLRIKTKETGFFGVSMTVMKYSRKNPVSGHPRISPVYVNGRWTI